MRGLSFEGVSHEQMRGLSFLRAHKFGPEEKYYVAFLFAGGRLVVKKTNFLKSVLEKEEESGGFKPPLFLIGIGIALVYQVACPDAAVLQACGQEVCDVAEPEEAVHQL